MGRVLPLGSHGVPQGAARGCRPLDRARRSGWRHRTHPHRHDGGAPASPAVGGGAAGCRARPPLRRPVRPRRRPGCPGPPGLRVVRGGHERPRARGHARRVARVVGTVHEWTEGPACGNALSGQGRDVPAPAGAVTDPDLGGRLLAGSGPDAKGSALSGRRAGTQRGPLRPSDLSQIREFIDHHRGSQGSSTTSSPVPPRGRGRRATRRSSRPGSRPAPPGGSRTSACGDSAEAGPTRPGRRTRSPVACVAAHRSPDAAHGRPAVSRRDPARPGRFRRLG